MSLKLRKHYPVVTPSGTSPAGSSSGGGGGGTNIQDALQNTIRFIPAEVVAAYPIIKSILVGLPWGPWLGTSLAAALATLITIALRFAVIAPDLRPQPLAAVFSTVACIVWIYAIGDYIFVVLPQGYQPIAGVAVLVISIFAPYIVLWLDPAKVS